MLKFIKNIMQNSNSSQNIVLILTLVFGFLLWLVDIEYFIYVFPLMVITSLIVFIIVGSRIYVKDKKRKEAIYKFLNLSNKDIENEISSLFNNEERKLIKSLGEVLNYNKQTIDTYKKIINDYEKYTEAWVNDTKKPLALVNFLLDNKKEEMSPVVHQKLEHANMRIKENIEKMMYYYKLESFENDCFFQPLPLKEMCLSVIDEYKTILENQNIKFIDNVINSTIVSDKRLIRFVIRQIVSNSIKYKNNQINNSFLEFKSYENVQNIVLVIKDNGMGVKNYDLPFIFEKGFKGDVSKVNSKTTGVGLYLTREVCKTLKIELKVNEEYTEGFEISISFPRNIM